MHERFHAVHADQEGGIPPGWGLPDDL
jgi:hypothetical protein